MKGFFKKTACALACVAVALTLSACLAVGEDHEHSYMQSVVPPTCTEPGYTVGVCLCGHMDVSEFVSPLGHEEGDVCYRCSTRGVEYVVEDIYTATAVSYNGDATDVFLAAEYKSRPVTAIADGAFCKDGVEYVFVPDTVSTVGAGAFSGCTTLVEIEVSESNPHLSTVSGVLYTKDGATLVYYPSAKEGELFTLPDGVIKVQGGSLAQSGVEGLVIPVCVAVIEQGALGSSLGSIYYLGTEEQWSSVSANLSDSAVTVYCFSESEPLLGGNYWRYDEDGKPAIWA